MPKSKLKEGKPGKFLLGNADENKEVFLHKGEVRCNNKTAHLCIAIALRLANPRKTMRKNFPFRDGKIHFSLPVVLFINDMILIINRTLSNAKYLCKL